jgi:hypothetical protein
VIRGSFPYACHELNVRFDPDGYMTKRRRAATNPKIVTRHDGGMAGAEDPIIRPAPNLAARSAPSPLPPFRVIWVAEQGKDERRPIGRPSSREREIPEFRSLSPAVEAVPASRFPTADRRSGKPQNE